MLQVLFIPTCSVVRNSHFLFDFLVREDSCRVPLLKVNCPPQWVFLEESLVPFRLLTFSHRLVYPSSLITWLCPQSSFDNTCSCIDAVISNRIEPLVLVINHDNFIAVQVRILQTVILQPLVRLRLLVVML